MDNEAFGWFGLVMFVLVAALYVGSCVDCHKRKCSEGKTAYMYEWTCVCLEIPK